MIKINNLTKEFNLENSISENFLNIFRKNKDVKKKIVLNNLSLEINRGEVVGLVGENGSGKSTLLKILSKVLFPTSGNFNTDGDVFPLLELGTGFNDEFSIKKNITFLGNLIGFDKKELPYLFKSILEFAEIDLKVTNNPLRTLSTGMKMRLAFSLMTAKRPDILLIDEALAVGDKYFQMKSFERLIELKKSGTTMILVSHDHEALLRICTRAVFIKNGNIVIDSSPKKVLEIYNSFLSNVNNFDENTFKIHDDYGILKHGSGEAKVTNVEILNENEEVNKILETGEKMFLKISVNIKKNINKLVLGIAFKDKYGAKVFGTNTYFTDNVLNDLKKDSFVEYTFELKVNFGPGTYFLSTALTERKDHLSSNYDWQENIGSFEVSNNKKIKFEGFNWLDPKLNINIREKN